MAHVQKFNLGFNINPPIPKGSIVNLNFSHIPLQQSGFNMPVEISTASAYRLPPNGAQLNSIVVMAHVDTGASITSIDLTLANHLNLSATGQATSLTAGGAQDMPTFAIDLSFPNAKLLPYINLQIGSCNLNFDLPRCIQNQIDERNFGLLIGRDVMSRWHITWQGPTSSVFVSD